MNIITKSFVETCDLYCEKDSGINGVPSECYHIKVSFDWRDVNLINECSEDLNYTIVMCFGNRLTIRKRFEYCLSKFISSRRTNMSIN